jgi:riboflavin kinase / FMN adenylyltransferase
MRRILGLEALGGGLDCSALTIGKFFAIHRGHQALLRATVASARREGCPAVVLTFDRHPLEVLRPGTRMPLLATLDERLDLIEALGLDAAVVARVDEAFLSQEPEEFVREVLAGRLGVREVLASDNFRFGRGARGDLELLRTLGESLGFRCTAVPPLLEGRERISSSRIGACITAGRVADAARLLGRLYNVPGPVVRGDQVGRTLGFPTANLASDPRRLLPSDGVYAVRVFGPGLEGADGQSGVANLGVRPTRGGRRHAFEVHLLDWSGDLYGHELDVRFVERVRAEVRFPDLEALKAQIARDVEQARALLSIQQ